MEPLDASWSRSFHDPLILLDRAIGGDQAASCYEGREVIEHGLASDGAPGIEPPEICIQVLADGNDVGVLELLVVGAVARLRAHDTL